METKNLIDKAIGFIQKNPKDNLSLQNIADNAGFSLTYFDAIFRQHTGYSPVEYARIYKLTRSALDLRRTEKSILDIALDFGYASPESFTRAFKSFYSISPAEYRKKYSNEAVTWHDLSGKIAISKFRKAFPELKLSDIDLALDFCFTHNPLKYAEDIIGMTVAETAILTLGDPETLEHFIYVSDYNSEKPSISLVCENEKDAILYVKLLSRSPTHNFSVRRSNEAEWEDFDAEIAKQGLICRVGYDMIYPGDIVSVPEYDTVTVRTLTAEDMPNIRAFKENGGCFEGHIRAIQIAFEGKGNLGMRPIGAFFNGALIGIAMPTLDAVRDLRKYDIGAIFILDTVKKEQVVELLWKYSIDMAIKDNAAIGNANATEDETALSISTCQCVGLVKAAINCRYMHK